MMRLEISAAFISWYGAILASITAIVLIVNSLRDRVNIRVHAKGNWRLAGASVAPYQRDKDYVVITVSNVGRRPVTIVKAGFKLKSSQGWLIASDSMIGGTKELGEGKSCDFFVEQELVDQSKIDFPYACDAVDRMYKGKWLKAKK